MASGDDASTRHAPTAPHGVKRGGKKGSKQREKKRFARLRAEEERRETSPPKRWPWAVPGTKAQARDPNRSMGLRGAVRKGWADPACSGALNACAAVLREFHGETMAHTAHAAARVQRRAPHAGHDPLQTAVSRMPLMQQLMDEPETYQSSFCTDQRCTAATVGYVTRGAFFAPEPPQGGEDESYRGCSLAEIVSSASSHVTVVDCTGCRAVGGRARMASAVFKDRVAISTRSRDGNQRHRASPRVRLDSAAECVAHQQTLYRPTAIIAHTEGGACGEGHFFTLVARGQHWICVDDDLEPRIWDCPSVHAAAIFAERVVEHRGQHSREGSAWDVQRALSTADAGECAQGQGHSDGGSMPEPVKPPGSAEGVDAALDAALDTVEGFMCAQLQSFQEMALQLRTKTPSYPQPVALDGGTAASHAPGLGVRIDLAAASPPKQRVNSMCPFEPRRPFRSPHPIVLERDPGEVLPARDARSRSVDEAVTTSLDGSVPVQVPRPTPTSTVSTGPRLAPTPAEARAVSSTEGQRGPGASSATSIHHQYVTAIAQARGGLR